MSTLLKCIKFAREAVRKEITANGESGDKYARGLANEGYAGGYLQALDDVDAAARHGYPNDPRGYWTKAKPGER